MDFLIAAHVRQEMVQVAESLETRRHDCDDRDGGSCAEHSIPKGCNNYENKEDEKSWIIR